MKFALFMGCKIPFYLKHYGTSTKAVLNCFDVKFTELEFNCCGYPNHDLHFESYILSAIRNIAMAQKQNLHILTPCKCCFGSLKHAEHWMRESASLREEINKELEKEGLYWKGEVEIKHLLSVLAHDVGVETIKSCVKKPQRDLKVAAHYGCHALRPAGVVQFDNPFAPTIFENLVAATGAKTVDWPRRLDCCGNPLWGKNREISLALMKNKIMDAEESGANCLCTACTYCQLQFDNIRNEEFSGNERYENIPSLLYTQLLGLSLGLPEEELGLKNNRIGL